MPRRAYVDDVTWARLRRLGYKVPTPGANALVGLLVQLGVRLRPLNRLEPAHGHLVGNCPICGRTDALFVAPGRKKFTTSCGCGRGEGDVNTLLMCLLGVLP